VTSPRESLGAAPDAPLQVVATAGHVDHGKSALILRLTGMDPDRWAEEKRRGLTIDLGFAWTTLPSGREIGFVDVPGHERFIANMLAGVGPVRSVLFVVAADEGWKPQSEEHLQILDVLGVDGAIVALTKVDLVEDDVARARADEIRARLDGSCLAGAPVVPVSSQTGAGLDALRRTLDTVLAAAPSPVTDGRPRLFVDRVFTIRGAGTVVTGTLTGGSLAVGQPAELLPSGHTARIRGLQTHKRSLQTARPISRVAVNLAGTERSGSERGDVLASKDQWRTTMTFEGSIRPVRGLAHPLTARGAYKVHAGSAERDARMRLYGTPGADGLRPGEEAFVRITLSKPLVLDVDDAFILREAGRRETVAGGRVLDPFPPPRPGKEPGARLQARVGADPAGIARRLVADRGAVRAEEVLRVAGVPASVAVERGALDLGAWVADPAFVVAAESSVLELFRAFHEAHPLRAGLELAEARTAVTARGGTLSEPGLAEAVLDRLMSEGTIVKAGAVVRLPEHRTGTQGRPDADRLVAAVSQAEPAAPTVKELIASGFPLDLIAAVCADGRLVRVSPDIVVSAAMMARAEDVVRSLALPPSGLTVSAFREALGTSRKYALPLLERFDQRGVTRRRGDVRILRDAVG
jgi:selenocysteine-specific elongation factor